MVVCFAVIAQFNSNICMKIFHHMSHEFDNQFCLIGYGIFREFFFTFYSKGIVYLTGFDRAHQVQDQQV